MLCIDCQFGGLSVVLRVKESQDKLYQKKIHELQIFRLMFLQHYTYIKGLELQRAHDAHQRINWGSLVFFVIIYKWHR